MLIDETHRKWLVWSVLILAIATAIYIPYALWAPNGPSGGSWPGLIYGIVGSAMMLFAGALSVRKKWRIWRMGRAQTWMRGHLWLGLISFPIILFHAGFSFGGPLTQVLMWLFLIVIVSGLAGAAFQHFIPKMMTVQVPYETIFEQIADIRSKLRAEADALVEGICAPLEGKTTEHVAAPSTSATLVGAPVTTPVLEMEESSAIRFREFYTNEVVPFLDSPEYVGNALTEAKRSEAVFRQIRTLLPGSLHDAVDDLESICEEERQLTRQTRLHRILHTWLLLHLPLSFGLLLLGTIHAIMALAF